MDLEKQQRDGLRNLIESMSYVGNTAMRSGVEILSERHKGPQGDNHEHGI